MEGDAPSQGASPKSTSDAGAVETPNSFRRDDEDEVVEVDPDGRYQRYTELVGKGRFKQVFKAFDTHIGIDVAWSKISGGSNNLTEDEVHEVVREISTGLELDHPNIIKCFRCWEDKKHQCINLVTELFTSGNLRQYRKLHPHLDLKAVKRMARQILKGLVYLHGMAPPVTHGDLRCDKIYVNGHTGEIKIGDLGLATLLPHRWDDTTMRPPTARCAQHMDWDIFALGLCVLELLTLKQLDPQHCDNLEAVLEKVQDPEARGFIQRCLEPPDVRPNAVELLEDPFLTLKKPAPATELVIDAPGSLEQTSSHPQQNAAVAPSSVTVGKLRGEDYNFEFHGKVKDGKMCFRLVMTGANDTSDSTTQPVVRTIDFVFDPEVDTAECLAKEISTEFSLSSTDTEICAAALREWLAKEMPGSDK